MIISLNNDVVSCFSVSLIPVTIISNDWKYIFHAKEHTCIQLPICIWSDITNAEFIYLDSMGFKCTFQAFLRCINGFLTLNYFHESFAMIFLFINLIIFNFRVSQIQNIKTNYSNFSDK